MAFCFRLLFFVIELDGDRNHFAVFGWYGCNPDVEFSARVSPLQATILGLLVFFDRQAGDGFIAAQQFTVNVFFQSGRFNQSTVIPIAQFKIGGLRLDVNIREAIVGCLVDDVSRQSK